MVDIFESYTTEKRELSLTKAFTFDAILLEKSLTYIQEKIIALKLSFGIHLLSLVVSWMTGHWFLPFKTCNRFATGTWIPWFSWIVLRFFCICKILEQGSFGKNVLKISCFFFLVKCWIFSYILLFYTNGKS